MARSVVVLVGLVLVALLGPVAPARSAQALSLTPTEGQPGAPIQVDPGLVEACSQNDATFTTISWTGPGRHDETKPMIVADLVVPLVAPGEYRVSLVCSGPDPDGPLVEVASGTGVFTVLAAELPPATVVLSPGAGQPGTAVTATGANYTDKCFPDGASLRVVGGQTVGLTRGPEQGAPDELIVGFVVPDLPAGTVEVELSCVDGVSARAMLEVLDQPQPAMPDPVSPSPPVPTDPGQTGGTVVPGPGSSHQGQTGDGIGRTEFAQSVPLPSEVRWTVPALLVSAALFTFLFWALGFPSEPLKKTLEENRDRIRAWFPSRGDPRRLMPDGWGGFALYAVLAAAMLTIVEPGTTLGTGGWWAASPLALGFLVAVPVTTLAYALPAELHARRAARDSARLRFLPGAMLFAGCCVALTRWADLQPGYVYGLFAFYAAVSSPQRVRAAGRGVLLGSACLLMTSLVAWYAWPPVVAAASAPGASYPVLALDAALAAVFVLGTQTLVFGLVPLRFLDGHTLKRWSTPAWALVWGTTVALLVHVLLAKYVQEVDDPLEAARAAAAFIAFGSLSAVCWLVFRLRNPEETGDPDEDGDPDGTEDQDGTEDPSVPPDGSNAGSRTGLIVGSVVVAVLVVVPVTIMVAGAIWSGSAADVAPADSGQRFAAVVDVDALNVRSGPSTSDPEIGVMYRGTQVAVRCTASTSGSSWYELAEPHQGGYASGVGLRFGEDVRPTPC